MSTSDAITPPWTAPASLRCSSEASSRSRACPSSASSTRTPRTSLKATSDAQGGVGERGDVGLVTDELHPGLRLTAVGVERDLRRQAAEHHQAVALLQRDPSPGVGALGGDADRGL